MKARFLLIFLLVFSGHLHAQRADMVFIGALSVKGSKDYPYKLQFKDSNNELKGYSVTDIMGPDQTRTAITGSVDIYKKTIHFRETYIIQTKSAVDKDSFCFIDATLKMSEMQGAKMLKGNFIGYRPNSKSVCGKGNIKLFSAADVLDKLMKIAPPRDTIPIEKPVISSQVDAPAGNIIQLSQGLTFEAVCDGPSASLQLWDDKDIDGDIVSVKLNGKTILDQYSLDAHKKQLIVQLTGQAADTVAFIAINEGTSPPNTARLRITSGTSIYDINASTKIGEPVYILLKHRNK